MRVRVLFAVSLAAATAMLLWVLPAAQAAETIYWSNYDNETLAFANLDGSGGGQFDTAGQPDVQSEGLTIDSATGRLYWSNFSGGSGDTGSIHFAGLAGGDGGQLNTGGATVNEPNGIAIDPTTQTIYWANYNGGIEEHGTISFAKLDGSAAGDLNTTGATLEDPGPIALDPANGRIYWANYGTDTISFANLNNSGGGGNLDLTGATPPSTITSLSVNPAAGQIYWISRNTKTISHANLSGGGGGDFGYGEAAFKEPYGMAFDPASGRIYWANYGNHEVRTGALGFANLAGVGGGIDVATAPVAGPQDPVILKGPSGTGAPAVTRTPNTTSLSCSQGSWAEDLAGSFVYQAPRSYSYQWLLNGSSISGATSSTYTATAPGAYSCSVTGSNQNGSATQTSGSVTLLAGGLKLALKKHKARAKAGHAGVFAFVATNPGDFAVSGSTLCVKVSKKTRKAVKTPKCRVFGVGAHATTTLKLRLKAKKNAAGLYKATFVVGGSVAATPIKAKLQVKPKTTKKHHRKHRHKR